MSIRHLSLLFVAIFAGGCSAGLASPDAPPVFAYMEMVGNTTTGAWAAATSSNINTAIGNAQARCGAFCELQGSCSYSSLDPTSPTWGAFATSGSIVFLGARQYLFGF